MHLLPGDYVICVDWQGDMALYDYSALKIITNLPSKPSPETSLDAFWTRSLHFGSGMFSTPRACGEHRLFCLMNRTGTQPYGIFVYDQKNVPRTKDPVRVLSLSSKSPPVLSIGPTPWLGYQQWRTVIRCAHSIALPFCRESLVSPAEHWECFHKHQHIGDPLVPLLDEGSGRVVFSVDEHRKRQRIIDFSLFPVE